METINELRDAIRSVLAEWEELPRMKSDWHIVAVADTRRDRYSLHRVDHANDRYDTRLLAYFEVRDGKIWILTDNTEEGVATDLVRYGVPKHQIVLAFYTPALREVGEFAPA